MTSGIETRLEAVETALEGLQNLINNHVLTRLRYHDMMLKGLVGLGTIGVALVGAVLAMVIISS